MGYIYVSCNMIYYVNTDGSLSLSLIENQLKIRPSICIPRNTALTGKGTKSEPFIIGGE